METVFVLTHAIMLGCVISIFYFSILLEVGEDEWAKTPAISRRVKKRKFVQIDLPYFSRAAAALLALFLRS